MSYSSDKITAHYVSKAKRAKQDAKHNTHLRLHDVMSPTVVHVQANLKTMKLFFAYYTTSRTMKEYEIICISLLLNVYSWG